jgi:hypothetical protein
MSAPHSHTPAELATCVLSELLVLSTTAGVFAVGAGGDQW